MIQENSKEFLKHLRNPKDSKRVQKIPKNSIALEIVKAFKVKKTNVTSPLPFHRTIKELEMPQQSWQGHQKKFKPCCKS